MHQTRFLALGDSYTIGHDVHQAESWPFQLTELLRGEGIEIDDPEVIATTGWTTGELMRTIAAANPDHDHAIVSLLIGVNDQYRGGSAAEYRPSFQHLLDDAVRFARDEPHRVLVLSIPDWGVTPFAGTRDREEIAARIDEFNEVNRDLAEARGAHYVDVTTASRQAGASADLLVADGLHPSGRAYADWARRALPAARRALAGQAPAPLS